jgi:hypothetical protein
MAVLRNDDTTGLATSNPADAPADEQIGHLHLRKRSITSHFPGWRDKYDK